MNLEQIQKKRDQGIPLTDEEKDFEMSQSLMKNMGMEMPGTAKAKNTRGMDTEIIDSAMGPRKKEGPSKLDDFMTAKKGEDTYDKRSRKYVRGKVDDFGDWITSESDYPDARAGAATAASVLADQLFPDPDQDTGYMASTPGPKNKIIRSKSKVGTPDKVWDDMKPPQIDKAYRKFVASVEKAGGKVDKRNAKNWATKKAAMKRGGFDMDSGDVLNPTQFKKPSSVEVKHTKKTGVPEKEITVNEIL